MQLASHFQERDLRTYYHYDSLISNSIFFRNLVWRRKFSFNFSGSQYLQNVLNLFHFFMSSTLPVETEAIRGAY